MIDLMFPLVKDKKCRSECDGNQSDIYGCYFGQGFRMEQFHVGEYDDGKE